jgi:hypothetical protein
LLSIRCRAWLSAKRAAQHAACTSLANCRSALGPAEEKAAAAAAARTSLTTCRKPSFAARRDGRGVGSIGVLRPDGGVGVDGMRSRVANEGFDSGLAVKVADDRSEVVAAVA